MDARDPVAKTRCATKCDRDEIEAQLTHEEGMSTELQTDLERKIVEMCWTALRRANDESRARVLAYLCEKSVSVNRDNPAFLPYEIAATDAYNEGEL